MSAEPGRKKAYSSDLRWRVVYQRIAMNREDRAKPDYSSKYGASYLSKKAAMWILFLQEQGWIVGVLIYTVSCMLLELLWKTPRCT